MKQLVFIFSFGIIFSFVSTQDMRAQLLQPDNPDTIQNIIRTRLLDVVNAAIGTDNALYYSFFHTKFTAVTEKKLEYTGTEAMEVVCRPALRYLKDETVQIVRNEFLKTDPYATIQSIEVITIKTDTGSGIAITGYEPEPKLMKLEIIWGKENDVWLMNYFYRDLSR